ncbi:MAG: hypothetical protein ACK4ZS_07475, partial [Sulfurimicrobium sp.]
HARQQNFRAETRRYISDCLDCSRVTQRILAAFQKHIYSAADASGNMATAKRIQLPKTSMLWDNQEPFLFAKKKP